MTKKPKPKTEMAIELAFNILWIYFASNDAAAIVREEGRKYGHYRVGDSDETYDMLVVSPCYDPCEVKDYLKGLLGDPETSN